MSGFGTVKPNGAAALQLTFPSNFSAAYKSRGIGDAYAPGGAHAGVQNYVGEDEQAREHDSRRAESHRMVMARVAATNNAEKRANISHAGFFDIPKPVLSQRRIGSNFGVGGSFNSSQSGESLHGGIIGSPQGREWVKDALRRRRAELDAIDANQFGAPLSRAVSKGEPPMEFSEISRIELSSFLDQLLAQASEGKLDFSPETFRRFFALLIRFASIATLEELNEINVRVQEILEVTEALIGERERVRDEEDEFSVSSYQFAKLLGTLMFATMEYLNQMSATTNMSPKDRKAVSRNALKVFQTKEVKQFMDESLIRYIAQEARRRVDRDFDDDESSLTSGTTAS